jgi:uncharacterized protein YllA (UPF0747 family)
VAIDIRKFPWIRRFATDYAFQFDRVASYFSGNPAHADAWAQAIARRQAHPGQPAELSRVLLAQQQRRGAPAAARAAAERLADPQTVVIITGQQAGLFGGPLFTLLKAATAMKLAEQIAETHNVTVVPVFWIDAEDHDWPEVSGCTVLDGEMVPRAVMLDDLEGAGHLPIGRLVLAEHIHRTLDTLQSFLPDTEFKAPLLDDLRSAYRPGLTMADAFGRWLESTLGARGLVVFDASDPAAKPLASRVFTHELTHPAGPPNWHRSLVTSSLPPVITRKSRLMMAPCRCFT